MTFIRACLSGSNVPSNRRSSKSKQLLHTSRWGEALQKDIRKEISTVVTYIILIPDKFSGDCSDIFRQISLGYRKAIQKQYTSWTNKINFEPREL